MEIAVHPKGFAVQPAKVPSPAGEQDAMRLVIVDHTGIVVAATFGAEQWTQFQAFIADPEGETARQAARAKIVGPAGLAPTLRRKH